MSEFKHTPEPWVSIENVNGFNVSIQGQGQSIAECWSLMGSRFISANASRIVACVNACKNVPNEWLQSNGIAALSEERDQLKRIVNQDIDAMAELQEQRDELFKALTELTNAVKFRTTSNPAIIHELVKAEQALAKVKGGSNG